MDPINIALVITTFIVAGLGIILVVQGRGNKVAQLYSINVVASLLWIYSMIAYRNAAEKHLLLWTSILYASATLIASTFLFFTYHFPKIEDRGLLRRGVVIFGINLFFIVLVFFSDTIIRGVESADSIATSSEHIIHFGSMYLLYTLYILSFFLFGFFRLYKKIRTSKERTFKMQAKLLLVGYILTATVAFATNLLLPWIGVFELNWLGQLAGVFMVGFATYSILRHGLFDARVVSTELFTFILWGFLLIRTILSETTQEQLLNGLLFIFTVIIGILLIRSVIKEVEIRERVERLASDLKKANTKLKEADHLKAQFLSIASHQFRSPLTAIKGYTSLILEGSYGKVPDRLKEPIERVFVSTNNLTVVVNDFLNLSRIEQGRMKYEFEVTDLKAFITDAVEEQRAVAEKKGLKLSLEFEEDEDYTAHIDTGKMKQVITNLIDNAIKYTPRGHVKANIERENDHITIGVHDSGVGIPKGNAGELFGEFKRMANANKVNVMGTGLGLYIARQIVEAHKGKIWAESEGEGKGSSFYIRLKAVKQPKKENGEKN